ncbi:hypothetical protein EE612_032471, partial [Oryza sativa]
IGAEVVYSKYAGTEVQFNDTKHLILKEDDIIGVLETDDVKDMKPLNDRVLIKVAEAEDKTAGGLILTETTKEKPSIGTPCYCYSIAVNLDCWAICKDLCMY